MRSLLFSAIEFPTTHQSRRSVNSRFLFPIFFILFILLNVLTGYSQPPIEPGVSLELARWRAAHYSDVRYKLNLTLEKMSPVLKGSMEIRVNVSAGTQDPSPASSQSDDLPPIILDWRKIVGHEEKSTISNVSINGITLTDTASVGYLMRFFIEDYTIANDHLVIRDGVVIGENVITLDFTSPILTSGSAITRYIDKEDGSEYIYSLFVPSDASTAFPVFDQPDLKARFWLNLYDAPPDWQIVSNSPSSLERWVREIPIGDDGKPDEDGLEAQWTEAIFEGTKPISTYVFAFAAGPFESVSEPGAIATGFRQDRPANSAGTAITSQLDSAASNNNPVAIAPGSDIYVRRSQLAKFQPHAAEVFRLNRESIKYFEEYFDYKFPFPKYDLVLIPEFPFGGMEHAGATFLRESAIIFPQEPTRNDHISRALLIFHEASHQWFGDTVTMRWFDDLWLKEGFATFTAYKALERIGGNLSGSEGAPLANVNAWKVFYERVKQAAYQTDSTKGTTPIYQEIPNLSAAKSAYGNIVYNKAPAFLRQAEFYLGEDKFQTAVRNFLKKHEFGNAGWEDLVTEFESASKQGLKNWAKAWVLRRGVPMIRLERAEHKNGVLAGYDFAQTMPFDDSTGWQMKFQLLRVFPVGDRLTENVEFSSFIYDVSGKNLAGLLNARYTHENRRLNFYFPNYHDYGYGIFLLDDKSRDYVLKNIQNEKDQFLRSMMWGALWDSVREGELDPRTYVELAIKNLPTEQDETIAQMMLSRTATAMNYYIDEARTQATSLASAPRADNTLKAKSVQRPADTVQAGNLRSRLENVLIDRMQKAMTAGQRITFYRAFLNVASSEKARGVLKAMLSRPVDTQAGSLRSDLPLRAKDKFDIVTRLLILGDPDAVKLLAEVEKTETGDDAKRYAYAARAGIATAENKAKYWNDFVNNKDISESWIEAAFGPWNSIRHSELTLPYLERALKELPNHKRGRKIFFVNGWLAAFIGGQRSDQALGTINKFLADNPTLDNDLRLKILENADIIERAVKIRKKN